VSVGYVVGNEVDGMNVPNDIEDRFEALAQATGRQQEDLLAEALTRYLDEELRDLAEIEEGLREADAGLFVPDEEMASFWARVTTPDAIARAEQELMLEEPVHSQRQ